MTNRGLNPIEAAEELGCSPDQVNALIKSGELKAYNIGRGQQRARYRIAESEIDAFRQRRSNGTVERRQPRKIPSSVREWV